MKRICVLGCGAWGTAVSIVIAGNVRHLKEFDPNITMYVRDEIFDGESLIDIINTRHVNPIYLPGIKIPDNVIAEGNLITAVDGADILALIVPPRYVKDLIGQVSSHVKDDAYFISFSKGLIIDSTNKKLQLISDLVREVTRRPCIVVSGATTAYEVANKQFTEATIGARDFKRGLEIKSLIQTDYMRLKIIPDEVGVELCGALKHVVAVAAGICDGLKLGDNSKAAVLRIGFWEMSELMKELFPGRDTDWLTIEQSCGMAELFICMAHRSDDSSSPGSDTDLFNITVGRRMSNVDKKNTEINDMRGDLRRGFVDGSEYAKIIYDVLNERNRLSHFPLFTAVHKVCQNQLNTNEFLNYFKYHPIHS